MIVHPVVQVAPAVLTPHPDRELYKTTASADSGTYMRLLQDIQERGIQVR